MLLTEWSLGFAVPYRAEYIDTSSVSRGEPSAQAASSRPPGPAASVRPAAAPTPASRWRAPKPAVVEPRAIITCPPLIQPRKAAPSLLSAAAGWVPGSIAPSATGEPKLPWGVRVVAITWQAAVTSH